MQPQHRSNTHKHTHTRTYTHIHTTSSMWLKRIIDSRQRQPLCSVRRGQLFLKKGTVSMWLRQVRERRLPSCCPSLCISTQRWQRLGPLAAGRPIALMTMQPKMWLHFLTRIFFMIWPTLSVSGSRMVMLVYSYYLDEATKKSTWNPSRDPETLGMMIIYVDVMLMVRLFFM